MRALDAALFVIVVSLPIVVALVAILFFGR